MVCDLFLVFVHFEMIMFLCKLPTIFIKDVRSLNGAILKWGTE